MIKLVVATLYLLTLAGCSPYSEQATVLATPLPAFTASPLPTPTVQPARTEPAPTATLLAASTPTLEGGPAVQWKDIPIMPGAITGEGDEEGYVFTIRASSQQVQDYYQLELAGRGWQSLSQQNEGSTRVLVFIDAASTVLTVSILAKGEEALVLLTK